MIYKCPVCNYNELDEAPYNLHGYGSYEICSCCGFQFGYDDYPDKEKCQKKWRENWMKSGCRWYSESILPPKDWNPKKQIKGLTSDY
ncbi:hypothetical protein [Clostridium beijerinckii]|uniref:hypothetical protein n=1 Tax=Clostridium beijerinckii TaxID=1520 RepID=UPI001493F9F5|nr:hypothetical protein [Clostridium beijerinckii]NOW06122.1 hypothetical protein [Clostridium beijerinckii]NYC00735.1 hypothetical protein [Clostridium beijerinckii]